MGLIDNDNLSLKEKERKVVKLVKERFEEIAEFTNETSLDDLIYYYKNMGRKRLNDFNNATKLKKRKW